MYQSLTLQILLSFVVTRSLASIIPNIPNRSLSTRECRNISPTWISQISSVAPNASYSNAISSNGAGSFFVYQNSSKSPYVSIPTLTFTNPSTTNQTCTLAATFPFFESQYLGWSLSSPNPPTLDISVISPPSNAPFDIPPTWTSTFFPENSDPLSTLEYLRQ
ncbi:uncharacterized protein Bfra_004945 [Botrytis fragariae]|uniref:Ubiquitin 3 binding protein But2 C-terminal domain-containing protein n=1 Tax=Botrytis fragariae TaxID=1964551 RepID=A0A8H6AU14_9HELO|nr:uncharacterized protein Bfra_004945 [Botrytis fragariae]KAF5873484.1 hypothetical protein Bfra_004945 [Botrytis fragariae]